MEAKEQLDKSRADFKSKVYKALLDFNAETGAIIKSIDYQTALATNAFTGESRHIQPWDMSMDIEMR